MESANSPSAALAGPSPAVSESPGISADGDLGMELSSETVDLSAVSSQSPYFFDRNSAWLFLPILAGFFIFLHVKRSKKKPQKKESK